MSINKGKQCLCKASRLAPLHTLKKETPMWNRNSGEKKLMWETFNNVKDLLSIVGNRPCNCFEERKGTTLKASKEREKDWAENNIMDSATPRHQELHCPKGRSSQSSNHDPGCNQKSGRGTVFLYHTFSCWWYIWQSTPPCHWLWQQGQAVVGHEKGIGRGHFCSRDIVQKTVFDQIMMSWGRHDKFDWWKDAGPCIFFVGVLLAHFYTP